jgi:hypothetical protein
MHVYGIATAPGDLPTSGRFTYHMAGSDIQADFTWVNSTGVIYSIEVDFAAGTIAVSGAQYPVGQILGTGQIDRSTGTFTVPLTANNSSGTLNGRLYGPQAAEIGGVVRMTYPGGALMSSIAGSRI